MYRACAKKVEDDDALVVRFYEWAGKDSDVQLSFPHKVKSAEETNLMERPVGSAPSKNGTVTIHTNPYEIKTVKVQLTSQEHRPAN